MVYVKMVIVFVAAVLSDFLQPGIRAQPTIGSSSEDDSCSQLEEGCEFESMEIMRLKTVLESERQTIKTLGNFSYSQAEEIQRLKLELESERCRQRQPIVTAIFVGSLDQSRSPHGITKVDDTIYVLNHSTNRIKVYEDLFGFRFISDITLSATNSPYDIVYSNKSKRVYISDYFGNCIWEMTTTGEHKLTKWLTNVSWPYTLSWTNEGHLLVLKHQPSGQLDIYSLNAALIRRIQLPQDVKDPRHVVQTTTGNFILSHRMNSATDGPFSISQLTNDGQLIHRFIHRNQSEELGYIEHMFLDSDSNRLFVADFSKNRVILFDSRVLTWSQVLLSQETNGILKPYRLFYDSSKKHLFVAQEHANVTGYKII